MIEINNFIFLNVLFSLIFLVGLFGVSVTSINIFLKKKSNKYERLLYNSICLFIIFSIILASVIQIAYSFKNIQNQYFYFFFLSIIFFGFYFIFKNRNYLIIRKKITIFNLEIYIFCLICLFFILSTSPPTDIDSIDYHLGPPLEWFKSNGYIPKYTWLHYRFVGLGENLNLIGVYFKTYNFGQIFQFIGLLLVIFFGRFFLKKNIEKNIYSILVLSCPVLLFLVATQKFQLFPSALIFCSFLFLLEKKKIDNFSIFFVLSCIFFSIGCKLSYIFPSLAVSAFLFFKTYQSKKILNFFVISIILFIVILFPLYLRNFIYFEDPVSPILENIKTIKDSNLINFLNENKTFSVNLNNFQFIKFLFLPSNFSQFTVSLGLLPLILLFINFKKINQIFLQILLASFLVCIIIFFSYRGLPRYYLEFYFLFSFVIAKNYNNLFFKPLIRIFIILSSFLVLIPLIYSLFSLSYGIINKNSWIAVMKEKAYGYSAAQWVNKNLENISKNEKILLSDVRFYSFFNNEFISHQYYQYGKLNKTSDLIKKEKIKYIFYLKDGFADRYFQECIEYSDKKEGFFDNSFRNPFNKTPEKMHAYLLKIKKVNC